MTPFALDTYTPLDGPHSTHPVLAQHRKEPLQPSGALSALSAILLGGKQASRPRPPPLAAVNNAKTGSTLLARRRGGHTDAFSLGVDLERLQSRPSKWPKASRAPSTSAVPIPADERDLDVPPLEPAAVPDKRPRLRTRTASVEENEEDLPPSPVGLPGGWSWAAGDKESALLLPPPFLAADSAADSFDGLLGTRSARESTARARREARLIARDRPPPPAFPQSLFKTASKLISALGPPGGLDSGPYRRWKDDPDSTEPRTVRKDRRRLERAESGLRGFDLGEKIAVRLADKLRKEQHANAMGVELAKDKVAVPASSFRAATPMSLFLVPQDLEQEPRPATMSSPPLLTLSPTPLLDPSWSGSTDSAPIQTPSLLFAPPKPKLAPIFDEAEPSPFPIVPPPTSAPIDDGYFALRQRKRPRTQPSQPASVAAQLSLPEPDVASVSRSHSSPASPPPHNTGHLFTAATNPIRRAVRAIERRARTHVDLVVWILIGAPQPEDRLSSVGGLVGVLLHLFGFAFFVLVHSGALLVSTFVTLRSIAFFLHWTFLNLTGRTDLSVVAREYIRLCTKEWNLVAEQDGVRLGVWSVAVGILEMAAIQAMSAERWISDTQRLLLLNGESEEDATPEPELVKPIPRRRSTRRKETASERPGLGRRKTTRTWTEDDGEGDSLLVTGSEGTVLEGTILNSAQSPALAALSPSFVAAYADLDDLPPLDLGDALPGFSFPPSPQYPTIIPGPRSKSPTSPLLRPVPETEDPLLSLLKTLKRHVRLATASYGLHSYLITPPSPLFTPSGSNFPSRVFAHLGGISKDNVLHVAIQSDYLGIPTPESALDFYSPQFYLLRDDLHAEVICVIRGTQSLADIRTDLEASLEDVHLPSLDDPTVSVTFRAHAGILAAARKLLDAESSPLFSKLKTVLEEHAGYRLVLTGHSLGAAIASSLALLIGQYTPANERTPPSLPGPICPDGQWTINSSCGLPANRPLRAICFAHPTTVDIALSRRCALGADPLVLSISLASDVVTRMGVPQVRELRRALGRLATTRRGFLKEKAEGEHGKSEVLRSWWKWKSLGGGTRGDGEKSAEIVEIEEKAWRWRSEMDGKREEQSPDPSMLVPAGRSLHLDRLPAKLEAARKRRMEELEDDEGEEEEEEETQVWGLYQVVEPGSFYSCPHLDAELVKSHLPKEYLDSIEAL
ncbi:hypothetical protein RQP46_004871 [Phenoliferia psychrophenolica]